MNTGEQASRAAAQTWKTGQVVLLAFISLGVGTTAGYFVRGSGSPVQPALEQTRVEPHADPAAPQLAEQIRQLNSQTDQQVAPLLDELKGKPNDATLLAKVAGTYFAGEQFSEAIPYFERALAANPKDVNARADLGTSYVQTGQTDRGIQEFRNVLKMDPKHGNTMFNLGIVQLQVKRDVDGAIATWKDLLRKVPNYQHRAQIEETIASLETMQAQRKASKR